MCEREEERERATERERGEKRKQKWDAAGHLSRHLPLQFYSPVTVDRDREKYCEALLGRKCCGSYTRLRERERWG